MNHVFLFDEVIARVKESFNCKKNKDLADILGIKPQTLSNRKATQSLPYDEIIRASVRLGVDVQYILTGVRSSELNHKHDSLSHLGKAADSNVKSDNLSHLGKAADSNAKSDNLSHLDSPPLFRAETVRGLVYAEMHGERELAEDKNGYQVEKKSGLITQDELELLRDYRACPDNVKDVVRRMVKIV